jgi:hypothetical protein
MEEDAVRRLDILSRAPELAGVGPWFNTPDGEPLTRAVRDSGLEYPVGLDNDFVAWNAYGNRYWPTMYLIDRAGQIRYQQIGEGDYGRTEAAIRTLLAEGLSPAAETRAAS